MGLSGLEPPTSRLSGVRSNQLSYKPILKSFDFSGDEEIRTLDPLLARQVLSQLSYTPIFMSNTGCWSSLFRQSLYSFVSFHLLISWELSSGLKWTRTTDLTLIRRAL